MSITTLFKELWRFIKKHSWKLVLGAFLGMGLVLGLRVLINHLIVSDQEAEVAYLRKAYQQDPAEFQAIITIEDGQLFANANVYDEYFSSQDVVQAIEAETGIQFGQWAQSERALELDKNTSFRGGLAAIRDNASGLFTFRFAVAQSPEDNLKIAQAYAKLLQEGRHPFNNHHIQIITQPVIAELLPEEALPSVATPQSLSIYLGLSPLKMVIYAILGLIIGAFIALVALIVRQILQDEITYAFEYAWDLDENHLLVSRPDLSWPQVSRVLNDSYPSQVIYLDQIQSDDIQGSTYQSLDSFAESTLEPGAIVILVHSGTTSKKWYQDQHTLAQVYQQPVTIVHLIED
ncbi:YveK family protein [Hutsoniella sourekii]|uniref:hypothetical protein n=1 Tax=Hutsoniella sourekii TaxID=87650 RepID=UPI000481DD3B|nr:hypothetical protein [Hutsoniella sourekii]